MKFKWVAGYSAVAPKQIYKHKLTSEIQRAYPREETDLGFSILCFEFLYSLALSAIRLHFPLFTFRHELRIEIFP